MHRRVIQIDEEKCNGCGACANACHESAIRMINGKAKLTRDDYCDGLGDCLPACPTGAITFIYREAAAYDEKAVEENKKKMAAAKLAAEKLKNMNLKIDVPQTEVLQTEESESCLSQWPVQLKLAPVSAPYYNGAELLMAADCTAYACASFHQTYMKNKITLIGCTKLDSEDYSEKLTEIFKNNEISRVHVVRMVVPCCRGMEIAVRQAVENSGKNIEVVVDILSLEGKRLEK